MVSHAKAMVAALLTLTTPLAAQDLPSEPPAEHDIALMSTIPIYWGERADMADLLSPEEPHWARTVIEADYRLRPMDYLSADALRGHRRLLLAQPRGLTAEENVALDAWVRGGGRVLLFADPMMTSHSRFAIGDRRRPQDVALLSPILAHWGLELRFDERQAEGRQARDFMPQPLPVDLPGELVLTGMERPCTLLGAGIAAECRFGDGAVMVVADAALLDGEHVAGEALQGLMTRIFGNRVPQPAPGTVGGVN